MASLSPKTVLASANDTLCLLRFVGLLRIPFKIHALIPIR